VGVPTELRVICSEVVAVQPAASVTVKVTLCVKPELDEYVCNGFCWVEVVPSPKFQFHCMIELFGFGFCR
jgi:hypothetical protein